MASYPVIQSPCPYRGQLNEILDNDICRLCKREVFDLSAMSDGERKVFFGNCAGEEVCVRYTVPAGRLVAIAALAAAGAIGPMAAAAETPPDVDTLTNWVIVGGVKDTDAVEFVDDPEDASIPELPIVYEEPGQKRQAEQSPVQPTSMK